MVALFGSVERILVRGDFSERAAEDDDGDDADSESSNALRFDRCFRRSLNGCGETEVPMAAPFCDNQIRLLSLVIRLRSLA